MNRHFPKLTLQSLLAGWLLAGASLLASEFLPVTNPGFNATANASFTFNGTNYFVGNPIPSGLFVNTLDATSTASIFKISDGLALSPPVTATVTGWTALGTLGTGDHNHAGVANFGSLSGDMANVVVINAGSAGSGFGLQVGFSQTLPGSIQLQPLRTYTLSMDLFKLSLALPATFAADFTVNGTPVGGTMTYNPPPNDSTPGSALVTYSTSASPPSGNLGIIFYGTDTSGSLVRIFADNFQVSDNIPEPSTVLLCGVGACLLWKQARRRRS